MTDIEAIRARHEAAQADGRYDLSWHEDHGLPAHADRAVLLARVAELDVYRWMMFAAYNIKETK